MTFETCQIIRTLFFIILEFVKLDFFAYCPFKLSRNKKNYTNILLFEFGMNIPRFVTQLQVW